MSTVLYSVTMSLDGFIAGHGGDMSWMTRYLGPNPTIDGLVTDVGALLVGHRTFGGDDPYAGDDDKEGKAFGGGWSGPQFVLTHHVRESDDPDLTFVGDIASAVAQSRSAAGERYVNVLGADVARQLVEIGELDEILVCIAPVLLGDGVRLYDVAGGSTVALERISLSHVELATNLWYRVTY